LGVKQTSRQRLAVEIDPFRQLPARIFCSAN
jgi:hypothetical protein